MIGAGNADRPKDRVHLEQLEAIERLGGG